MDLTPDPQSMPFSTIFTLPPLPDHCSAPSADIFSTQLVSLETDSSPMMYHAWHTYPPVIEQRAEQALHMIDEQMGF